MSQQKTLTNLEKAKDLRAIRKRLGWTQPSMARALGLDFTYLSQLENGKRPVDEFYLTRAREIADNYENSKKVKEEAPAQPESGDIVGKCHAYLDRALAECQGDRDRMTWVYVELQRHFPLKAAKAPPVENPAYRDFNSISAAEAAASVDAAERALALEQQRESRLSSGAGGTSGRKSGTSRDISERSKGKPSPPKQAPK